MNRWQCVAGKIRGVQWDQCIIKKVTRRCMYTVVSWIVASDAATLAISGPLKDALLNMDEENCTHGLKDVTLVSKSH